MARATHRCVAEWAGTFAAWTEATGVMVSGRMTTDRYDDGVASAGLLNASPTLGSTPAERFLALSIGCCSAVRA